MIDVPIEVKKALKRGRNKKAYRFEVYDVGTEIATSYDTLTELDATDNTTYTVFGSGTYRFYNDTANTAFSFSLTNASGTTKSYAIPAVIGATETDYEIDLSEGTEVVLLSSNLTLDLQFKLETEVDSETYLFTIGNDNLIAESVRIDERMCSEKVIKFGLCEGSSLEFQYFGFQNITGKTLKVFIDVEYTNSDHELDWYSIPMGYFTVDQCPMQFSTGIFKATAYNKLQSKYLDQKANNILLANYTNKSLPITMYDIKRTLLSDYQVEMETEVQPVNYDWTAPSTNPIGKSYKTRIFSNANITSPLNIYMAGGSASSTASFNFSLNINRRSITLDPSEAYYIDSWYNLDQLEKTYYSKISKALSKSGVSSPSSILSSWIKNITLTNQSQPIDGFPTDVTGWANVFGIVLVKQDNSWEYYSSIGYTNSRPNCKGTGNDLAHKLITGYKTLFISIPGTVQVGTYIWDPLVDTEYTCWTSSSRIDDSTYPRMRDAAGQPIELQKVIFDPGPVVKYFFKLNIMSGLSAADKVTVNPSQMQDYTLRDIVNATYETMAQYGKLDRETDLFSGVELNKGELFPDNALYPDDGLYPSANYNSAEIHPFPSEYQKLWTDAVGMKNFRYLRITYKTTSGGEEVDKVLQRTINTHGTNDYNMSDNWLFRNLVWTSAQVGVFADAMVPKMKDISWFPFEMWAAGLPYIETGDSIEITDRNGDTHISYILQRQLNGIHNLQDTFINGELEVF